MKPLADEFSWSREAVPDGVRHSRNDDGGLLGRLAFVTPVIGGLMSFLPAEDVQVR